MTVAPFHPPIANVIDMYHGDNRELMPDFKKMKAAGVIAIAHKVSQGLGFKDPTYRDRVQAARDAGLLILAYHYLVYGDALNQAHYFLLNANLQAGDMAVLDYERGTHSPNKVQALAWLRIVTQARNAFPAIYGGDLVRESFGEHDNVTQFPLWLSQYATHLLVPKPWTDVFLWQFSDRGQIPGITGRVDTNFFNGTRDDLAAIMSRKVTA